MWRGNFQLPRNRHREAMFRQNWFTDSGKFVWKKYRKTPHKTQWLLSVPHWATITIKRSSTVNGKNFFKINKLRLNVNSGSNIS